MKRKISFLAYGFVLSAIWSVCFLDGVLSDAYTSAMGLSFTFLSVYFLQKEYDFRLSTSDKIAVITLPVLFLVTVYVQLLDSKYFVSPGFNLMNLYLNLIYLQLVNPVTIATVMMVLSLTQLRDLSKLRNAFIFGFITLFHAYLFSDIWLKGWLNRF